MRRFYVSMLALSFLFMSAGLSAAIESDTMAKPAAAQPAKKAMAKPKTESRKPARPHKTKGSEMGKSGSMDKK